MALNLRQKQTECLTRMLNPSGNASKEVSYKILIYDEFCKNILAPLFHVKDLLKQRVTLRLLIDKDRKESLFMILIDKSYIAKIRAKKKKKIVGY